MRGVDSRDGEMRLREPGRFYCQWGLAIPRMSIPSRLIVYDPRHWRNFTDPRIKGMGRSLSKIR